MFSILSSKIRGTRSNAPHQRPAENGTDIFWILGSPQLSFGKRHKEAFLEGNPLPTTRDQDNASGLRTRSKDFLSSLRPRF